MRVAATTYGIRCRCGGVVGVAKGQAGGTVTCPKCGSAVAVPRLRDLPQASIAVPADAPVSAAEWSPRQAWLTVGLTVAVVAAAVALGVGRLDRRGRELPDAATIRGHLEAVDAATVQRIWYAARRSGIDRGSLPAELAVQRSARAARGLAVALWILAAAGGLVVAGAACSAAVGPGRSNPGARGMKAAYITRTGPPEVIVYGDLPDPVPGPRQALVRVRAAAINPIDTYVRGGTVPMPLEFPFVVGCDLAGDVVAVGDEVDRLRPGMRVWGSNQGLVGRQGTCAELAAVDERWLYPTPDGVTDREAAAAALVSITAHLGLVSHAALQPGETIFVSGGSGGVGSAVIQIARAIGGRVIATAGTPEKRELVLGFGADVALDYHRPDLVAAVLEAAPGGVHVHWETRREPDFDAAVAMLAEGGRLVLMAGRDARPPFPVGPFYVKGCRLAGFVMFKADAHTQAAAAADINRWLASGRLRAGVDRVVTLPRVAEAHALQEAATVGGSGGLAGKIVVEP